MLFLGKSGEVLYGGKSGDTNQLRLPDEHAFMKWVHVTGIQQSAGKEMKEARDGGVEQLGPRCNGRR